MLSVPPLLVVLAALAPSSRVEAETLAGAPALTAVDARDGVAIAVGARGAVFVRRGTVWRAQAAPTTQDIQDVAMERADAFTTVSKGGQFLHHDGRRWTSPAGDGSRHLYGVSARDGRGVTVGHKGRIFHRSGRRGQSWRKLYGGPRTADLRAVTMVGEGRRARFVAVGDGGAAVVVRATGDAVTAVVEPTGTSGNLVAIAACPGPRAQAVAVGGAALVRTRAGVWNALPALREPATGVVVQCEQGAVQRVVAATRAALAVLDVDAGGWRMVPIAGEGLRDLAWLDARTLVIVGEGGLALTLPSSRLDEAR